VGRAAAARAPCCGLSIAGSSQIDSGSVGFGQDAKHGGVRVMFQEPRLLPWARVLFESRVGLGP